MYIYMFILVTFLLRFCAHNYKFPVPFFVDFIIDDYSNHILTSTPKVTRGLACIKNVIRPNKSVKLIRCPFFV
jgi:hypothetical protein